MQEQISKVVLTCKIKHITLETTSKGLLRGLEGKLYKFTNGVINFEKRFHVNPSIHNELSRVAVQNTDNSYRISLILLYKILLIIVSL